MFESERYVIKHWTKDNSIIIPIAASGLRYSIKKVFRSIDFLSQVLRHRDAFISCVSRFRVFKVRRLTRSLRSLRVDKLGCYSLPFLFVFLLYIITVRPSVGTMGCESH